MGGKASALSRLELAGLPVPAWFVVSPAAFVGSLSTEQEALWLSGDGRGLRDAIAGLEASVDVAKEICGAIATLKGTRFAVRSSAVDEDCARDSFAGQLASYLFVESWDVGRRVADVWRSGFSEQIVEYRRQRGLAPCPSSAPAVLVQEMVDADSAGVAFSADPVSGRAGLAIVSAVFGLGTALVGGEADADLFAVNRSGVLKKRMVAHKEVGHSFSARADGGVEAVEVEESLRDAPVLSDEQAVAVADLARRSALVFGRPQDIEWAFKRDKLFLLQSRPITTLENMPDPDGVLNIWDNSNIIESYSGVTTPLTFSFARYIYEGVYREFCRILRVPERKIAANEQTFAGMLGLIQGRVYYNLLNWYRVLALLPGFTFNRRFMEQMMGVRENLPDEVATGLASASRKERITDAFHLVGMIVALVRNLILLENKIAVFRVRLNQALSEPSPPLSQMRLDELTAHYGQLRDTLLTHWDAPLINDFFAMIFHGALRKATMKWLNDADGTLANDAIRGEGGMISAEPAARVRALSAIASGDKGFVRTLCEGSVEEALAAIAAHPDFQLLYQEYLNEFGDRCLEELKLESESLDENPLVLLRSVGALAAADHVEKGHNSPTRTACEDAEAAIESRLRHDPLKRTLLFWILRNARRRVRQRENLRFERTRLFGRVRRIFRECGKRLYACGILQRTEDVFYLEVEEILAFVNGKAVTADLGALATLRRSEFERYKAANAPPDRFETRGAVYCTQKYTRSNHKAEPSEASEQRAGIGCCPGVVRGEVCVVLDPRNAQLPAGRILVAEHTDPGWIMLFPSATGLLVERGSLLSHSAIVARELGIPAVVSIRGLTRWLRDGDIVELDGARGTVRRIARGEVHEQ
ncbi:MAG TPA: PEP/pyruvate-binding domain-containing protein [Terracidiphilus sp.]|jgi:pyruvate,water dikinase